ncbi:MAG TPA: CPBP family intramembrane glutamic endopeptidase [Candidatus Limnocylindrales bacterium]|nr:CPBP family intramembrane glutamic endopeptidase [Candidatus Limnocylindrales bacterium]
MNSIDAIAVEGVSPRDPKPRVWHLAALFALSETVPIFLASLTIGTLLTVGMLGGPVGHLTIRRARHLFRSSQGTLIAMACVAVVCMLLAIGVGLWSSEPFAKRLRTGRGLLSTVEIAVASAGGLALSSALGTVLRFMPGYESGGLGRFHKLCAGLHGTELWLAALLIGLLAPLGEELFYRGAMQTRLMERFGTIAGVVLTSAVFGIAHLDPLHMVVGVVMGLYLGWISVLSKSCRTTIAVHGVNNSFAVLVAVAGTASTSAAGHGPADYVASGTAWLLIAAGCVLWLQRRATRRAVLANYSDYSNLP